MRRLTKQIVYGLFYLIVFGGIFWAVYLVLLKPAPTCFDNIQNQGEEGIDCGGPCAKACLPSTLRPIDVEQVLAFSPDRTHISLLAVIRNYNTDYAAKSFRYNFRLYGNGGNVIETFPGESFIYSSEIKYLAAVRLEAPTTTVSRADLQISNPEWVAVGSFPKPNLSLKNIQVSSNGGNIAISGQVTNGDTVNFPQVLAVAVLFGKLNQFIGVSQTEIDNLAANETRPFVIYHPPVSDFNATATDVFFYAPRP